jgi:hypothetical protein
VGLYHVGDAVHILPLLAMMLLMPAFLRAREAALRRTGGDPQRQR